MKRSKANLLDWQRLAQGELGPDSSVDLKFVTPEGIEIPALCVRADVEDLDFLDTIPGDFPYVRGARATMYRGRPWTIRQYAGFSTAEESNAFYRRNLAMGQTALSVAFDLATHRGYDSDHPRVAGDVGKAGVAIDTVEDMKRLFAGIPLGKTSVSMTMNGAVLPVLAAFIVAAEEQGVPPQELMGTIQNDVLKEFMVRNTYIYPPEPSLRIAADVISYISREMPRFNSISISGYHMHEAGATADLELGFTIADGLEYVRAALGRGFSIDDFAPRLSFFFAVGMNFFVEIAKLRAARLLWATLVQRHFVPKKKESLLLRTHCQTSGISLTAQDPYNNIVRTTIEALAAVLGGTQSLHTNAFDEALALPSEFSAAIARNTQLILQHETSVTGAIDPLGGAYFIERLTHTLAAKALTIIEEVEAVGGMVRAIEQGLPQNRIAEAATRRQARIDRAEEIIVGLNRFQSEASESKDPELLTVDNRTVMQAQLERLAQVKTDRNTTEVARALTAIEHGARSGNDNLLALTIVAMRARATVGEVTAALEKVWPRHESQLPGIAGVYAAEYANDPEWGRLRNRVDSFAKRAGRRPRLLVAKLGQDGHDRGAKVVASAFVDLGFDVDIGPLFQTAREAARQAVDNDVHIVGVSTQAGAHLTLVPELLTELKQAGGEEILLVCGGVIPKNDVPLLLRAGARDVFGPGTPILQSAERLLSLLEQKLTSD